MTRGFNVLGRAGNFSLHTMSRPALRSTLGIKWPGHEVDHSLPFSIEVKNAWSYTLTSSYIFTEWCLIKHRHGT